MVKFGQIINTESGSFGDNGGSDLGRAGTLICHKQNTVTTVTMETGDLEGACCYNITTTIDYSVELESMTATIDENKKSITCADYPDFCNGETTSDIDFDVPDGTTLPGNIGDSSEEKWLKGFCAAMNPPPDGPCGGFDNPPGNSFSIIMTTYAETCYTEGEYRDALPDTSWSPPKPGLPPPGESTEERSFPCGSLPGWPGRRNNSLGLKVLEKIAACICDITEDGFDMEAKLKLQILMASISKCATMNTVRFIGEDPGGTWTFNYPEGEFYQQCLDAIPCPAGDKSK